MANTMNPGSDATATVKWIGPDVERAAKTTGPVFWKSSDPNIVACAETSSKGNSMKLHSPGTLGTVTIEASTAIDLEKNSSTSAKAFTSVDVVPMEPAPQ